MRLTNVLFAAVVFPLGTIRGGNIVVSGENPKAADRNPGTEALPLKTISAAAAKVQAGDKVLVHGGEYRETVIITASGTVESPIIFEAATDERPVIKGSEVVTGWQRVADGIWKAPLPEVPERSPNLKIASYWQTNDVRMVFVKDGESLDAHCLRRRDRRDELQPGTFFVDRANNTLLLRLDDGADPNPLRVEATTRGTWMNVWGSHVTVRGFAFRHCANSGQMTGPGCFLRGDDVLMENCQITWSDHLGVLFAGNGDRLVRCLIACHGNSGLGGTGEGHVIDRCRVLNNNLDRYDPAWHCGGAKLIPRFCHSEVTHNEFAYNVGPGLWLDSDCNDNLVEGNFCHDNEGPGIMIEISARNRIFNNLCVTNRNYLAAEYLTPESDPPKSFKRVRHGSELLSQFIYHAGDGRGIYIASSPESKVYHNTCYLNEGEGICVEGQPRALDGHTMTTRGTRVLNNISLYNKGTQLVFNAEASEDGRTAAISDYNIMQTLGAVFAQGSWNSSFLRSLRDWQKTGSDQHSSQDDPGFAMAAMGDFRLLPGSPALNAAPALKEVRYDFAGKCRDESHVSIGAFESSALDYPRTATSYLQD